jgi:glycine dehydrogenase subunit 1
MGGPGVGLFAAKKEFLRQLPGRLVGQTTDQKNNTGYVLTLAAREQHIRREKATSNICTNHNLMALAFAMTCAAYGKSGFYDLALTNLSKTQLFREELKKYSISCAFSGSFYNETVINLKSKEILDRRIYKAKNYNIISGLDLSNFYPELSNNILITTTELHDDNEIKLLAQILGGAHD